ncbi:S9 family peptidase [Glycocaulis profundi]|nr:S9 family peptidase [Glycocaulis profundi]
MRFITTLGLVFCLTAALAAASAPPASDFAELPAIHEPALSPDGTRLAYATNQGEDRHIIIVDLATGERSALGASHVRVEGLYWVGDTHLVVRAGNPRNLPHVRGVVDFAQLMSFDTRTQRFQRLVRQTRNMGFNPDVAQVQAIDHEGGRVLIRVFSSSGDADLYWVDVSGGSFIRHERGNSNTTGWVLGPDFQTVARLDRPENGALRIFVRDGRSYEPLPRREGGSRLDAVYGLDETGTRLIASERRRGRVASVVSVPLDGEGEDVALFDDRTHDVASAIQESYTNAVIGVEWADTDARTRWFSDDLAELQSQLEASLEASSIRIQAWSRDRTVAVVQVDRPDMPAAFYIYRQDGPDGGGRLEGPLHTNAAVAEHPLPERVSITYTARDGVEIPGYLTLPDGPGPHPFVVLPHGGPAARDYGGYDYFAHFLASRGYGVVQPNFRGSAGYGRPWRVSGHGEWGLGLMQHDLTDAVEALVESGMADPSRICIAGGSYGGYAALAGAAFTPELYACAISINGVSSLQRMLSYTRDRFGPRSTPLNYWRSTILNDVDESEGGYLRARSPADNAEAIRAPVLLIHGRDDSVVPVDQSRRMASVLRRQGRDVRLVEQSGGDHWLTGYAARRETLEEIEGFLALHLAPRTGTASSAPQQGE